MGPSDSAVPLDGAAGDLSLPRKQRPENVAAPIKERIIQSPDPEYRNVPVHVSRKNGNTVRAEAPPVSRNRQTTSTSRNLRQNQKKKGPARFGDGNNSDSDSDSDSEHRRKHNEDSTTAARRRKPTISGPPEPPLPDFEAIEREERERTQLLRSLREVADNWERLQPARSYNRKVGLDRRRGLLRRYDEMRRVSHENLLKSLDDMAENLQDEALRKFLDAQESSVWKQRMGDIQRLETKYKKFLDKVLRVDIEEKLLEVDETGKEIRKPSIYLEDVLLRVEKGVIVRCEAFEPAARRWDYMPPKIEVRIINIVMAMYQCLWRHLLPLSGETADVRTATAMFLEKKCPDRVDLGSISNLEKAYMTKLVEGLVDAIIRDRAAGRANPDEGGLGLVQIISRSRQDGHLTPAYMDWICSAAEPAVVDQCCVEWQKGKRDELVATYRETMQKMGIQQEFCPSIIRPGIVSLVLFKGNFPATIRDVSHNELKEIGWFLTSGGYWRYETCSGNEPWSKGYSYETAFKVGMDGKVLGMKMMDGEWLGWDDSMDVNLTADYTLMDEWEPFHEHPEY